MINGLFYKIVGEREVFIEIYMYLYIFEVLFRKRCVCLSILNFFFVKGSDKGFIKILFIRKFEFMFI